jgi:hypothetical protein
MKEMQRNKQSKKQRVGISAPFICLVQYFRCKTTHQNLNIYIVNYVEILKFSILAKIEKVSKATVSSVKVECV